MNLLNRGALLRLYMSLEILSRVIIASFDERSMQYEISSASPPFGWIVLAASCVFACIALADTAVNDFLAHVLPKKLPINGTALNMRHLVYMGMAFTYALQILLAFDTQTLSVIPYYFLSVVFLTVAAFADVRARYCRKYVAATVREAGHA